MSLCSSSTPLLKADLLDSMTWSSDEDLSSGYESNPEPRQEDKISNITKPTLQLPSWPNERNSAYLDSDSDSDSECDSSELSDDISDESSDEYSDDDVDKEDRIKYSSIESLCDSLEYILTMPDLCDVMFLVGPEKVPVYGVKALLTTRSRAFFQLILGATKEAEKTSKSKKGKKSKPTDASKKLTISIPDLKPEVFKKLVKFIHCGLVDLTAHNVIDLLYASLRYCVSDLSAICRDYIDRSTTASKSSIMLHSIEKYKATKEMVLLKNKILQHLSRTKLNQTNETCPTRKETEV